MQDTFAEFKEETGKSVEFIFDDDAVLFEPILAALQALLIVELAAVPVALLLRQIRTADGGPVAETALSHLQDVRRHVGCRGPRPRHRGGRIVTVTGPSGCGKSTPLRLVASLEVPDAGTVAMDGELVAGPDRFVPPERAGSAWCSTTTRSSRT